MWSHAGGGTTRGPVTSVTMTYCKVFVDEAEPSIVATLSASLYVPGVVVEVRRGNEPAGAPDDFVRWPVIVELEAEDDGPAIVEATAELLRTLWDAGHRAVAACDFEADLPWEGGIGRLATR
jgi:hypothetical protein